MRVLVVEDDASLLRSLTWILETVGHTASGAATAEDALSLYREQPFPWVIADCILPGMGGLELTRLIRHLPQGQDAFIMIATACDTPEDLHAALKAGADDWVAKPFQPNLFAARIAIAERSIAQRQQNREFARALTASEKRFSALFRRSPAAAMLVRVRDRVVMDANDELCRIFGFAHNDVVGGSADHLARTFSADSRQRLAQALSHGVDHRIENETVTFARAGGERSRTVRALASVETVEVDGEACWLVAMNDVTELEDSRAQEQASDRMRVAGTLAAGVAHEINNPLHFVVTNLCYALEELLTVVQKFDDARAAEKPEHALRDLTAAALPRLMSMMLAVEEARIGADRVHAIVEKLNAFAQPDDRVGPIDIHEVLENAIALAGNELSGRARLIRDFGHVGPVHGSAGRLVQVFVNLLVNAAQAIGEGDAERHSIRVSTALVSDGVRVIVSDTGRGIAAENLPRIFDPFFTTRDVGQGMGLGLHVCYSILTSCGGRIAVDSELGRGTAVSVVLRPSETAAERSSPVQPMAGSEIPAERPRRGRILVIDDEVMIGRAVTRALASEHDVVAVTRVLDAIDSLRSETFDLILCDLMLPDVTGMSFHAMLEETFPEYLDKIIFISGGAFTAQAREFMETKRPPSLDKPLDIARLKQIISDRLGLQT